MKLIDFMKYQIHFRDKDEKYIKDFLVAMKSGLGDTDLVGTLSEEQYNLYLNKGNYDFYYDKTIIYNHTIDKIEIELIKLDDILTEKFIKLEILIAQHPTEPIETYPGILAILSNTDNPELFHNIDHALVMPYLDSFFLFLTKLDPNILRSIQLIKALRTMNTIAVQKSISNHFISRYINSFLQLLITDFQR